MRKNMNNLILITPAKEHESQVMEFREEMLKNGEDFYGCSGLNSVSSYDDWLDFEGRFKCLGWTPSATYLGIRISDGKLIGMIDLRHELSGFLLKYNGRIISADFGSNAINSSFFLPEIIKASFKPVLTP